MWDSFRNMDRKDVRFIDGQKFTRTIDAQEMICKKYNVTLLYYRTKWQRRFDKVEHIVNVIKSGLSRFKRGLDKLHEQNQARQARKPKRKGKSKKNSRGILDSFSISEKDYSKLTGRTTSEDLDFITGRSSKKDMSFITGGNSKRDLSFITGKQSSGKSQKKKKRQTKTKSNSKNVDDIVRKLGW
jgi:hypothetical protein